MKIRSLCKNTCFWRCVNTKPGKYVKFIILLLLDLLNLCVDWYFFLKISLVEPGLVYGPPNDYIKLCTLIFCVVSVFSFVVETMQNGDDLFCKRKISFLNQSFSNFSIIFFEDIPLLVLNLIVTLCRDGEPSMVSVIKATVCIVMVGVRLLLMILVHWVFEAKKTPCQSVLDFFSTIGLCIIGIMSVMIQLFNTFPTNSNGMLQVVHPAHLSKYNYMNYVTEKYLNGVGIYSKWPMDDSSDETESYIFLANITEVIDKNYVSVYVKTNYTLNKVNYTLCFSKFDDHTCYMIRSRVNAIQLGFNASSSILASDSYLNKNGYHIGIMREPAQEFIYKVGYLDYNLNRLSAAAVVEEQLCSSTNASSLLYAKFTSFSRAMNDCYLKNLSENEERVFYDLTYDLLTVDRFWKTGILGCEMSGDKGPKLSRDIRLTC